MLERYFIGNTNMTNSSVDMHKNAYKVFRIMLEPNKVCMKMPIIRKVIGVGRSRAVTIPKTWLDYYERESGEIITEVAIEVNRVLTIKPILSKKEEAPQHE